MISTWILTSIIGITLLIFGIPKYVDIELSGAVSLMLGIPVTAIGITGLLYSFCG
jgi:hypothetical protein